MVDSFIRTVSAEDAKCDYQGAKNLVYKDCDHRLWPFYSCDEFMKSVGSLVRVTRYDKLTVLLTVAKKWEKINTLNLRRNLWDSVLYAADVNMYFCFNTVGSRELPAKFPGWRVLELTNELRPLNTFGGLIADTSGEADNIELEFVPAWIDKTDEEYGHALFLPFGSYDEPEIEEGASDMAHYPTEDELKSVDYWQKIQKWNETVDNIKPAPIDLLSKDTDKDTPEYYDRIYIGWWDGSRDSKIRYPFPWVDTIYLYPDWSPRFGHFSLRLNDGGTFASTHTTQPIEPRRKTTFKFLSDTVPDPRSLFNIRGRRYICEKITATITERGLSQLMTGLFYEVRE